MEIGYCRRCNIPLRDKRCEICGSYPLSLRFHELGDIRPASHYEMDILLSLIPFREVKNYLRRRIVLLAKQPGLDYRKDIFVDGFKFGVLEYIKDGRWRWRFVPTGKGVALIHHLTSHVDFEMRAKGHMKGKKIDRKIDKDWEIVKLGNCVAIAVKERKGVKIKDVYCRKIMERKRSTLKDAVRGNTKFLERIEREAVEMIIKSKARYVAFSGGKDSEVALYLSYLAGVKKAVFLNTGMEFPETVRFVYNFVDFLDMELIELSPQKSFWDLVEEMGIPTKDRRWCTKYLKLEQLKKLQGVIVDGLRKYESLRRLHSPSTRKIGNLRTIYPIFNWLSLDVWLYIHSKGLPYNPLYDMGFERLGCYMCPAMLNAEFHRVKVTHPELFKRWYEYLRKIGYTHEEIMDGNWRWKEPPPKLKEL
ncbi:MAG: phosphoadenosine phosphosulfate reductase family protein [Thermoplasmata archaeon]|nr:phosphoadenosine phosphosulfate reductase family protein [Thermoplasmata archaeon]